MKSIETKINTYDVHTHMHDEIFVNTAEERMQNLQNNNIHVITIGTDERESRKARDLAHKYKNVYYTVGLHPHDNLKEEFVENNYMEYMSDNKCVAVGECGLDYYYIKNTGEIERQRKIFIKQIEMAKKYNKPLMIHGRPSGKDDVDNPSGMDAYEDMLSILEKYYDSRRVKDNKKASGNVHFFVGDYIIAKRFMSIGFTFSFGGVLTLTREYDEIVKYIPLEYLHAETDSPYVIPKDEKGVRVSKINSSENIDVIISKIAQLKSIDREVLKKKLEENFKRDFLN